MGDQRVSWIDYGWNIPDPTSVSAVYVIVDKKTKKHYKPDPSNGLPSS